MTRTTIATSSPRPGTKQAIICDLLARKTGASLDDLVKATGWQPHTARAALTGLRKRGMSITKEKVDSVTRYFSGRAD